MHRVEVYRYDPKHRVAQEWLRRFVVRYRTVCGRVVPGTYIHTYIGTYIPGIIYGSVNLGKTRWKDSSKTRSEKRVAEVCAFCRMPLGFVMVSPS
jgi:hypothetical protein